MDEVWMDKREKIERVKAKVNAIDRVCGVDEWKRQEREGEKCLLNNENRHLIWTNQMYAVTNQKQSFE